MKTLLHPENFHKLPGPVVLAAGFFDGVHQGHRRVLESAVTRAGELEGTAWALTFDQHPLAVLAPARRPPLLTPLPLRLERIASTGLNGCLMLSFTPSLAALEPVDFVSMLTGGRKDLIAEIRCGDNWRFGAKATGTPEMLARLGRPFNLKVVTVPAALYREEPISSTRIRKAIRAGKVAEARAMLGREYIIRETVVRGRGVGRTIGMATANLHPRAEVLPSVGVYAVKTWIGDREIRGVADIGWRPTFRDARPDAPVLEIHLLDFNGDLYGATLDIAFVERIRNERKFQSIEALLERVRKDIACARTIFAGNPRS